jgi:hypothetical protein
MSQNTFLTPTWAAREATRRTLNALALTHRLILRKKHSRATVVRVDLRPISMISDVDEASEILRDAAHQLAESIQSARWRGCVELPASLPGASVVRITSRDDGFSLRYTEQWYQDAGCLRAAIDVCGYP